MNKYRILCVDDEPSVLSAVAATLEDKYEIIRATNAKDALDLIDLEKPDLVIMDVMMPEMDGFEAVKKMKQGFGPKPPVIFLSAKATADDVYQGLKLSGFAYITKPFQPSSLIKKVEDVFERLETRKRITEMRKK